MPRLAGQQPSVHGPADVVERQQLQLIAVAAAQAKAHGAGTDFQVDQVARVTVDISHVVSADGIEPAKPQLFAGQQIGVGGLAGEPSNEG